MTSCLGRRPRSANDRRRSQAFRGHDRHDLGVAHLEAHPHVHCIVPGEDGEVSSPPVADDELPAIMLYVPRYKSETNLPTLVADPFEPGIGAQGSDPSGLAEQPIPRITTGVDDRAGGLENPMGEAIVSEMEDQAEVFRHGELAARMPARPSAQCHAPARRLGRV